MGAESIIWSKAVPPGRFGHLVRRLVLKAWADEMAGAERVGLGCYPVGLACVVLVLLGSGPYGPAALPSAAPGGISLPLVPLNVEMSV